VCLRKDPKQRVGDIRDVRLALEGAFETAAPQAAASAAVPQWRRVALVGAAAVLTGAVVATTLTWVAMRPADAVPPRVSRVLITSPGTAARFKKAGLAADLPEWHGEAPRSAEFGS